MEYLAEATAESGASASVAARAMGASSSVAGANDSVARAIRGANANVAGTGATGNITMGASVAGTIEAIASEATVASVPGVKLVKFMKQVY